MILQVMPIIVPHSSNGGSYVNVPEWLTISLFVLLILVVLAMLILLIKIIFDW